MNMDYAFLSEKYVPEQWKIPTPALSRSADLFAKTGRARFREGG